MLCGFQQRTGYMGVFMHVLESTKRGKSWKEGNKEGKPSHDPYTNHV